MNEKTCRDYWPRDMSAWCGPCVEEALTEARKALKKDREVQDRIQAHMTPERVARIQKRNKAKTLKWTSLFEPIREVGQFEEVMDTLAKEAEVYRKERETEKALLGILAACEALWTSPLRDVAGSDVSETDRLWLRLKEGMDKVMSAVGPDALRRSNINFAHAFKDEPPVEPAVEPEVLSTIDRWIAEGGPDKERASMLTGLQRDIFEWCRKNFPDSGETEQFMGVVEEVGELAHAILKARQGIRLSEDHEAAAKDAVGDIGVYLLNYCSFRGWDFGEILRETFEGTVSKRDWTTNKEDGIG